MEFITSYNPDLEYWAKIVLYFKEFYFEIDKS